MVNSITCNDGNIALTWFNPKIIPNNDIRQQLDRRDIDGNNTVWYHMNPTLMVS